MKGITRDCLVEMVDRKIIYVFAVVTVVGVLSVLFSSRMNFEFQLQGDVDMESISDLLRNPLTKAISSFMTFMLFLVVMASAGVVPNMLVKGRVDFYLSKPLSRTSLFLNKLLGIWVTYGTIMVFSGGITYLTMVVVFGSFDGKILYLFVLNLVSLLIWLSITMTVGILSGSTATSIMSAFLVWVAQLVLSFHEQIKAFVDSKPVGYVVDALYYVVPKTGELSDITQQLALGKTVDSWMPLYSSLIVSMALIYLATAVFNRKDY